MSKRRNVITAVCWIVGVGTICALLLLAPAILFSSGLDRAITARQRIVLYQIDHPSLSILLRDFATHQRWSIAEPPKDGTFLYGDDPSLPPALKLLKPSSVGINDEHIDL